MTILLFIRLRAQTDQLAITVQTTYEHYSVFKVADAFRNTCGAEPIDGYIHNLITSILQKHLHRCVVEFGEQTWVCQLN